MGIWGQIKPVQQQAFQATPLYIEVDWQHLETHRDGGLRAGGKASEDDLRAVMACRGALVIRGGHYAGPETTWLRGAILVPTDGAPHPDQQTPARHPDHPDEQAAVAETAAPDVPASPVYVSSGGGQVQV